jgi:hypothetical protein
MSILELTATFGQSATKIQRPARPAVPLLGNEPRVPAIGVIE